MKLVGLWIATLARLAEADMRINRLDIWNSGNKSKKVYSLSEKSKLTDAVQLRGNEYLEAEVIDTATSEKLNPDQVALLLNDERFNPSIVGLHPSIQVQLKTSEAGGAIYRATLNLDTKTGMNPEGSVYRIAMLLGMKGKESQKVQLGKVTLLASETRSLIQAGDYKAVPELSSYQPKPTIDHQFRPAPQQPAAVFSTIFTGLVLSVPLGVFGIGLKKLSINLNGLRSTTSTIFAGGFGLFGFLLVMFFWTLTLVQTVAAALLLAAGMCFVGNKVLRDVRSSGELKEL